jgi:hypothetical protein
MENLDDKYLTYLLANPYHMKQKNKQNFEKKIDNEIIILLKEKYKYEIKKNNMPIIFEKIEKILIIIHQSNIIDDVVNDLIKTTINNTLNNTIVNE